MIEQAVAQFQGIIWQAAILGVVATIFGGLVVFAFMYMFLEREKGKLAVALVVGLTIAACTGAYFVGRANSPVVRIPPPVQEITPPPLPLMPPSPHARPRVKKQAKITSRPVQLCHQCSP